MSKEGKRVSDVYEEMLSSMTPFFEFLLNPVHFLLDTDKIPNAKELKAKTKSAQKKLLTLRKRYQPELYQKMVALGEKKKVTK